MSKLFYIVEVHLLQTIRMAEARHVFRRNKLEESSLLVLEKQILSRPCFDPGRISRVRRAFLLPGNEAILATFRKLVQVQVERGRCVVGETSSVCHIEELLCASLGVSRAMALFVPAVRALFGLGAILFDEEHQRQIENQRQTVPG